jgi:predicted DNA-binding transcriptional regulator AlpA
MLSADSGGGRMHETTHVDDQGFIGIAEVRRLTGGPHPTTIWRGIRDGRFPAPVGWVLGRRVWRRTDVLRWLAAELASPAPRGRRGPSPRTAATTATKGIAVEIK